MRPTADTMATDREAGRQRDLERPRVRLRWLPTRSGAGSGEDERERADQFDERTVPRVCHGREGAYGWNSWDSHLDGSGSL